MMAMRHVPQALHVVAVLGIADLLADARRVAMTWHKPPEAMGALSIESYGHLPLRAFSPRTKGVQSKDASKPGRYCCGYCLLLHGDDLPVITSTSGYSAVAPFSSPSLKLPFRLTSKNAAR
jgi:hypothetical protein